MTTYIIRRLLLMLVTLLGISIVIFTLVHMVPGGPVEIAISKFREAAASGKGRLGVQLSSEEIENIKAYYGFDKPLHIRYFHWVWNMLHLDFGKSYSFQKPVWEVISSKFPISLFFGLISLFVTYLISVPLGVMKALKDRSLFDTASSVIVSAGYVMPGYALGVLLILFFAGGTYLKWFPMGGAVSEGWEYYPLGWKILDFLHHMVLPLICYVIGSFAVLTQLMKNSIIEEVSKDYVRTALAKGVPYRTAVIRHALRNSLIPIVTGIGGIFTVMFTGALLIEKVFDIDGMGRLMYDAMISRDYNVVLAEIMIVSVLTLIGRLVSDIAYVFVDPRIRLD
jgi:microcin C transport system permease protein